MSNSNGCNFLMLGQRGEKRRGKLEEKSLRNFISSISLLNSIKMLTKTFEFWPRNKKERRIHP